MKSSETNLNRREFIGSLAMGGISIIYNCSKNSKSPTENEPPPSTSPPPATQIALFKTQNRTEGVKKVLELLNFAPVAGKKVLLKPNFNTADPAPASTHNDTLIQIVKELQTRNASDIILTERSYHPFNEVIYQKEIDKLAQNLGFEIRNLNTEAFTRFTHPNLHWQNGFDFPNIFRDAEYIVSTCCLKTHQYGGVFTMSLKLSVGCIPSKHMNELHNDSYMRHRIAEINLAYTPNFIVMDGIKVFIDGGPTQGTERLGEVMIAGTDRVAIDAVGVAILKHLGSTKVEGKIFEQEQIKRAVELSIGIKSPDQIEFITPNEESHKYAENLKSILANG